ncbi:MAG: alpha-1,3-fucosyltransferase [Candidatus Dadabacteria bacterium]|nr:alpha-1,3-fucosyltransferase [Candidatus Dadabacteria bacterium]
MEDRIIILFYNSMWGQPLEYQGRDIPEPFVITEDRSLYDKASAVVFHVPSLGLDFVVGRGPVKREGQIWIAWSMESAAHHPVLSTELVMRRFDLTMNYRQDSDIWCPYILPSHREELRNAPTEKTGGCLVNAFISSRHDTNGRTEYLREMMKHVEVHSYGKLFRNVPQPKGAGRQFKLDTMARYKFTVAFENASDADYVTEKFYDPLIAGSVPLYLGAPNIEEFSPGENCFINVSDFEGPESLSRFLLDLSRDPGRYSEYFDWKKKPFLPGFEKLLQVQNEHALLRLCRKVGDTLQARAGGASSPRASEL